MNPHIRRRLAGIVLSVALVSQAAAAESAVPFRAVSFEAATQAAAKEGKLVFIDFYTTWCEPCKRLDALTWTDAAVGKLVGDKAVALKLDAEKEGRDLAKRYKIEAYPTLLLLKADGTEVDRIVGFSEPAKFMADFNASVGGKTTLKRAVDAVDAAPNDHDAVQARFELGRTLARNDKPDEALAEYLWCYDDGMRRVASFSGVRNSFLVSAIAQLGAKYQPALDALRERRDQAEAAMLSDASDRVAAMDFASLNGALKEPERTLLSFESFASGDPRREVLLVRVYDLLIEARRYDEAAKARPFAQMESMFKMNLEQMARMAAAQRPAGMPDPMKGYLTRTTAKNVEVLIGSGQIEAAQALAKRLLEKVDGSPETLKLLRAAAARAGRPGALSTPETKI